MKRRTFVQASPLLFGLPMLTNAQAAYPKHAGERGHPVGFAALSGSELQNLKGNQGAAGILSARSATEIIVTDGMPFSVQGKPWEYHEKAYLMLHKPAGFECSHRPGAWPSTAEYF